MTDKWPNRLTMRNLLYAFTENIFTKSKLNKIIFEEVLSVDIDIDIKSLLNRFVDDLSVKGWNINKINNNYFELNKQSQDIDTLLKHKLNDNNKNFEYSPLSLLSKWILSSNEYIAFTKSAVQRFSIQQQLLLLRQQFWYCNAENTKLNHIFSIFLFIPMLNKHY